MNRLHATKDFWLAALRADGPALQQAAAQAGPDAAVPGREGETVADLVDDLTGALHFVRDHVSRGVLARPADFVDPPRPAWPEALEALRGALTSTVQTLESLDADFPAWNWAPQAKTASFWQRRMAHQVSLRRWDAESAAGRGTPIETKLAADGVSEILDTWLPAGRRTGPTDVHGVAHLAASDAGYEWFIRLRGHGVALLDTGTILDDDDRHARVHATGTASDLLLALTGRQRTDRLVVSGDLSLISALRVG